MVVLKNSQNFLFKYPYILTTAKGNSNSRNYTMLKSEISKQVADEKQRAGKQQPKSQPKVCKHVKRRNGRNY